MFKKLGMSSRGRTSGFDPGNEGSNPSVPSKLGDNCDEKHYRILP